MFAVYVHLPFCKQKCKYCDFNSYAGLSSLYGAYVDALISEISARASGLSKKNVGSVYIGGGTPTLLDPSYIDRILSAVEKHFVLADGAEISIEANPETISASKLASIKNTGVNRISIGFQSLDEGLLGLLGRKHSAEQAVDAFKVARSAGFENISVDLIFGIPGQSLAGWAMTLEQAVALDPEHISCYGLAVEPNTALEREIALGKLQALDEDLQADMFAYTMESLEESGYEHYEISNYARPGRQCRHNLVYWDNSDYIGFGAGAHSKIGNKRFYNVLKPGNYIKAAATGTPVYETTELSEDDMISETLFLGLRKMKGVSLGEFNIRFGRRLQDIYSAQVKELTDNGLIKQKNGLLKLTRKGILLGNEVFSRFV